jgi:hypothetical protein
MIQEMSVDLLGERFAIFAAPPSAEEVSLAKALAEDAAGRAAAAGREREYAEMAQRSIRGTTNEESRRELQRIAVWHYERSAEAFRCAAAGFESAAKIQKENSARRRLLKRARAAADAANRAECVLLELKRGAKIRKGGTNNETG